MPRKQSVNHEPTLFDIMPEAAPLALVTATGLRGVPRTLAELKQREGLPRLKTDALEDREDQIAIASILAARLEREPAARTLLQKPTGTGKTYDAWIFAAKALDEEQRIIFLTTRNLLVSQAAGDLFRIVEMKEGEVALHSEGKVSAQSRALNYADENRRIIIATDDTFRRDLEAGIVNLKDFTFIIDEVHNREYLPLIEAIRDVGVPALGISATLADDPHLAESLCRAFGVHLHDDVFEAHIDTGVKEYQDLCFELDERAYDAGIEILSILRKGLSDLLISSIDSMHILRTPGEALEYAVRDAAFVCYKEKLEGLTKENLGKGLGEVLGSSIAKAVAGEMRAVACRHFSPKLKARLIDRLGEECTGLFEAQLFDANVQAFSESLTGTLAHYLSLDEAAKVRGRVMRVEGQFADWDAELGRERRLPFQTLVGAVRYLALEIEGSLRATQGEATLEQKYMFSKTIEIQELCRYHEILSSMGLQSFLHEYASKFLDFYMRKTHGRGILKNPKADGPRIYNFEERLYRADERSNLSARRLYKVFKSLAQEAGEGAAQYHDTFRRVQIIRTAPGGDPRAVDALVRETKVFLDEAMATAAAAPELRTPKELALFEGISGILREDPQAKILVYAEYEHLVRQLALSIEALSRAPCAQHRSALTCPRGSATRNPDGIHLWRPCAGRPRGAACRPCKRAGSCAYDDQRGSRGTSHCKS